MLSLSTGQRRLRDGAKLAALAVTSSAALRRGTRTGLTSFAGFALGRWGLERVDVAVFATFSAIALLGVADFGGPRRARAGATVTVTIIGLALAAAGTWAAVQAVVVSVGLMFVVGAASVFAALLGGYATAGATAVILFYLVAAGSPAPMAAIPARLTGVAVGGILSLLASLYLWPERHIEPPLLALAATHLRGLAARLGIGATPEMEPDAQLWRATIDALSDRPAAPTRRTRAALYLVNDLERLTGLVAAISTEPAPNRLAAAEQLATLADRLTMTQNRHHNQSADPIEPSTTTQPPRFGPLWRLHAVIDGADQHLTALLTPTDDHPVDNATTLRHAWRRITTNLTAHSVHLRDAARTGLALAMAIATSTVFSLQHGFWVAFATLTVVRSSARTTASRTAQAVAGTLIGWAVSAVIVALAAQHATAYAVLVPIAIAVAIALNVGLSFAAGQAGFTVAIVVLFNLIAPQGWRLGLIRVEDVLAGAVLGLLAGLLAWPRGAASVMYPTTAYLLRSAAAYLAASVRDLACGGARTTALARQRALAASTRADSAFAQYLAERHPPTQVSQWSRLISAGNRLWYSADLLRETGIAPDVPAQRLLAIANTIETGYATLATSIERGHLASPSTPDTSSHMQPLLIWLASLARPPAL